MNTGKSISLAKAKADFGAMLRLAERGVVRIHQRGRIVAILVKPSVYHALTVPGRPPGYFASAYKKGARSRYANGPERWQPAKARRRPKIDYKAAAKALRAIGPVDLPKRK